MLLRVSIARFLVLCLALGAIQAQHKAQAQQTGTKRSLFAADYQKKIAAVLDADNKPKWKLPIGDIHDAQPLADGRWLTQTSFGNVVELDADGKEALLDLFDQASAEGAALVVATHELSFVSRTARTIALRDGSLVFDGESSQAEARGLVAVEGTATQD